MMNLILRRTIDSCDVAASQATIFALLNDRQKEFIKFFF
jgi:hypothetical protein